jgi:hypothetical protein
MGHEMIVQDIESYIKKETPLLHRDIPFQCIKVEVTQFPEFHLRHTVGGFDMVTVFPEIAFKTGDAHGRDQGC